jgi:hypothetical protein
VILAAAVLDLAGGATEPFPFVTSAVARGNPIDAATIEWRDVPIGLLGDAAHTTGVASRDLAAGEPLVAGAVTDSLAVPSGWWAVPVDLPDSARPGMPVRLIAVEPTVDVEGVVAQTPQPGAFAVTSPGLVAVPPDVADVVAQAASGGRLVVLLGT